MAKLYTEEKNVTTDMCPKKETIDFILSYSKALKIVQVGTEKMELHSN